MSRIVKPVCLGLLLLAVACVTVVRTGTVEMRERAEITEPRRVLSPMKAFLADGATAVYPWGAQISSQAILGAGTLYSVGLTDTVGIETIELDRVIGIEAFQGSTDVGASILASMLLTGLATVGTAALAVAIFGSCPTFYAAAEQGMVLEAEAFSYSIAPLLEARDLDALSLSHDADGIVRLEMRNEALETHYINHLELLAVDHAPGDRVIPNEREAPVAVASEVGPLRALDRGGREVLADVAVQDDAAFASSETRIRGAVGSDPFDHLELTFPAPRTDEAVVVLRLRNSLLTTVLFYDLILGRAGAGAVDWIGQDMARIGTVVELGKWFQDSMGLRVAYHDGERWIDAGRVVDTGPIAWEEVGVVVPVGEADRVRVRLTFFTDAWRIDQVSLGELAEIRWSERVPVARMRQHGELVDDEAVARLAAPDDRYLTTYPGTAAVLELEPPVELPGWERSYLLASQGYYTEWIRPDWIRSAEDEKVFRPDEETVETLMSLWLTKKDAFEADFYSSKIPVR